jgi:hypothetical protein
MMKWESIKQFLRDTLDLIEDIFAIIIALSILLFGWFVDKDLFQNSPLLWSGIVAILTIMAIGNLRDRRRRLWKIHQTVDETLREMRAKKKFIEISGADDFFEADEDSIQNRLRNAKTIDIVGITLSTTVGSRRELVKDRLKEKTTIRIIILDNNHDDSLEQLVKRSWSKRVSKKRYGGLIDHTSDLLEDIGIKTGLKGSFRVGYLPFLPSVGMILVDSNLLSGAGIVEVYHQLAKASKKFYINQHDDPRTFEFYRQQFELMWSECEANTVKTII